MFTVGIFSTHLPYIAFVLFYGFFFLAGIEKASAGDLGDGQQEIREVFYTTADCHSEISDEDLLDYNFYPKEPELLQLLFYEKKISLFSFYNESYKTKDYRFSWFSRPPPVAFAILCR